MLRTCTIRRAKMETGNSGFRTTVVATMENEAPWTMVTHKSRTPLQPPPSSITTKNKYEALTATDAQEQGL